MSRLTGIQAISHFKVKLMSERRNKRAMGKARKRMRQNRWNTFSKCTRCNTRSTCMPYRRSVTNKGCARILVSFRINLITSRTKTKRVQLVEMARNPFLRWSVTTWRTMCRANRCSYSCKCSTCTSCSANNTRRLCSRRREWRTTVFTSIETMGMRPLCVQITRLKASRTIQLQATRCGTNSCINRCIISTCRCSTHSTCRLCNTIISNCLRRVNCHCHPRAWPSTVQ
mmetsp:Transcript_28066/g.74160  ORF Transcript_28066/g.74160 Transcript_28066/m.74160 type:complete len:228 (-) Transcript_28066:1781-2464(-)